MTTPDLFTPPEQLPPLPLPGLRSEHAKPDALAALASIQAGPIADRYRALLERVTRHGHRWPDGTLARDLTDFEAADLLGVERTTVNAARAEVARRNPGAVVSAQKRRCLYRPSNVSVNAWAYAPALPTA